MRIPLLYNLRTLTVRKTTSAMTVVGVALTVAILVADFALVSGLRRVFQSTVHPAHILVLRKGASGEVSSSLPRAAYEDLKFTAGITKTQTGDPFASLEIVTVINLPSIDSPDGMNVTLRGLGTMGIEMRKVAIREGRWFRLGKREVVVCSSLGSQSVGARVGQPLNFRRGEGVVVGVMDCARSVTNSEIWGELGQIISDFNRQDTLSSVLLRAENVESVNALINTL